MTRCPLEPESTSGGSGFGTREYSNELWHTDWHDMKHPAYEGKHLIVYEDDDASRCIMGYGLFDTETSSYSVEVLDRATIREHEKPRSVLSDRGSTFYAVEAEAREKGLTEFELYLMMRNHIAQILSGVRKASGDEWEAGEAPLRYHRRWVGEGILPDRGMHILVQLHEASWSP